MFRVRCPRASPARPIFAVAPSPLHAARTHRSLAASRPPARSSPRTVCVCPAYDPRQGVDAFNQPLSWDISQVTNMLNFFGARITMFGVRCSPRLLSSPICVVSRPLPLSPARRLCTTIAPYTRGRRLARRPSYRVHPLSVRLGSA